MVRRHLNGLTSHNTLNGHGGTTHQAIWADVIEANNRKRRLNDFYARLEKEYTDELVEMSNLIEFDDSSC